MNEMVLFILVYFAAIASAKIPDLDLALSKIEATPNNTIQNLQFEDLTYNLTDFTICTWIKLLNLSHTQTIFSLTGNKKEPLILWQLHVHPKETMRMTIRNRLVASEGVQLVKGQWSHVCFQWKGLTGVWAMFVNTKIHSVGQLATVGNDTAAAATWRLHGKGTGTVGDDSAPCRNAWQAYGLYMTGSADVGGGNGGDKPSSSNETGPAKRSSRGKPNKNNNKRQAVFNSEPEDPGTGGGSATPKPFQWFSKTFAFVKRMFTFVIIPFFKFVRNTFFQTRSVDDTVVDVSETHLTVSDVKFEPSSSTAVTTTTAAATADDFPTDDDDTDKNRRHASSSKRETNGADDPCGGSGVAGSDRVTVTDLVAAGAVPSTKGDLVSPNARRYLRMVSDGLNDVGVNAAFVRRAFTCCGRHGLFGSPAANVVIDWDRTRAQAHNVTVSPHVCGRS